MAVMTIRSDFQADVDRFIADLTEFATGSYLKEGETEFWEAPFDVKALPELKSILEKMLDALELLPDDPDGQALATVVNASFERLRTFNSKHEDAVLEPEEWEEIQGLIASAAAATGADDDALAELPNFDD